MLTRRKLLTWLGLAPAAAVVVKEAVEFDDAPPETPYIWPDADYEHKPPYSIPQFINEHLE